LIIILNILIMIICIIMIKYRFIYFIRYVIINICNWI